MDEIIPMTVIWTISDSPESPPRTCLGCPWSGPWQLRGPISLPHAPLSPWLPQHPSFDAPPYFITQVSHYQEDFLPRPFYLKHTSPLLFVPFRLVIFLRSSNSIFNVALSIVSLCLLCEDLGFICVVCHYVPVT